MKPQKLFLSLRKKLVILLCALIAVPFAISALITYQQYTKNVKEDSISYTKQIIDQIAINLDRYIKDMDRLTMAPYYDNNALGILRSHSSSSKSDAYVTSEESAKMNLMISSLAIDRSELQSVLLFAYDGSLFSNLENTVSKRWDSASNPWIDEVEEADGGLVILPPHRGSYYLDQPDRTVVSVARVIRETLTDKHIGLVKVDLTRQGFEKILATVTFSQNSRIYVSDRKGRLLYSADGDVTFPPSAQSIQIKGKTYLIASSRSAYTGMKVTGLIPKDDLKQGARKLTKFTLWISLSSVLAAFFAAGIASGRIVKPIRHLQMKMKKVQKGNFTERAVVTTRDEIGQLTEGFNIMVSEIDRLVKEVYEGKLRQREAELDALQSQINPHFIYNTLETINSLALDAHQHEVSEVVVSLGRLLRYTVERTERLVYLRDEISFVAAYLQICNSRFGEQLRTEIEVELGHDYLLVPRLIVQPLIENAIEHAMGAAPLTIKLFVRIENDHLLIFVQDDGEGMDSEKVSQVERHIYSRPREYVDRRGFGEKKKGYALRNVHWRLFLLYGEPCGLFIEKNTRRGAVFYLRLPLLYEEDADA